MASDPIADLKNKIDAELPYIKSDIANKVTADFKSTYRSIMDQFYKRDPDVYRRVPNLKYAFIGAQKHSTNNDVGGIKVGGSYAPHVYNEKHGITTDNVLSLMWDQGIRGLPERGTRILGDGMVWENPVFMTFTVSVPNTSSGTPASVFDEYYDYYYDNELDAVCDNVLIKYLDKILD